MGLSRRSGRVGGVSVRWRPRPPFGASSLGINTLNGMKIVILFSSNETRKYVLLYTMSAKAMSANDVEYPPKIHRVAQRAPCISRILLVAVSFISTAWVAFHHCTLRHGPPTVEDVLRSAPLVGESKELNEPMTPGD